MLVALTSSSICAIVRSVRPLRVIFDQIRSERMNFQCCTNKCRQQLPTAYLERNGFTAKTICRQKSEHFPLSKLSQITSQLLS